MALLLLSIGIILFVPSNVWSQPLTISLPDTVAPYSSPVRFPIFIENASQKDIVAVELGLVYTNSIVAVQQTLSNQTLVQNGWAIEENTISGTGQTDTLLIAMSTARDTLSERGTLLHVILETADIRIPTKAIFQLQALVNDGTSDVHIKNGSLTLTGLNGNLLVEPDSIFIGQSLDIQVEDLDEDLHSSTRDTIIVKALSQHTGDQQDLRLIETGLTTGVFQGQLITQSDSTNVIPNDDVLNLSEQDQLYVVYTDQLTAAGITDTQRVIVPVRKGRAINVSRYSLLAIHSMHIENQAEIKRGFVGVTDFGEAPFLSGQVALDIDRQVVFAESVIVSAPRVRIDDRVDLAGTLVHTDLVSVGSRTNIGLIFPVDRNYWPLIGLPDFLNSIPGTADVTVRPNGTEHISPGDYDHIVVRTNGTLIFTGGDYHIKNMELSTNANVVFEAPSVLYILEKLDQGNRSYMGPRANTSVKASDIFIYVSGVNGQVGGIQASPKAVSVGVQGQIEANVYVPNGTIVLQDKVHATGSFIAKDIVVGKQAVISHQSGWPVLDFESPLPPLPELSPSLSGDFDNDGDIDLIDFLIFANAFGHAHDPQFDLNNDGFINIQDLLIFVRLFKQFNH